MNTESANLARRALASKHFRWMGGMRWIANDPELGTMSGRIIETAGEGIAPLCPGALPDVDDPATIGCLIALGYAVHGFGGISRSSVESLIFSLEYPP